jgi:adenylate cyclase
MNLKKWLDKYSIDNKGLYYKISLVFGLLFLAPIFGFLYFAVKYDILDDQYVPIFFLTLLCLSFFCFVMLRRIVDVIRNLSIRMTGTMVADLALPTLPEAKDELGSIVNSFQSLESELRNSIEKLGRKATEISTLKELSDLCYVTFNPEDLLYIALERSLKLTNADVGSVMILERSKRDHFTILASLGLGEFGKKGTCVNFEDSIAKYAVLNKSPLLVEDIETDTRFGRQSRSQYASKSFICMPLKTLNDVIGVLTVSRRRHDAPFTRADVDILTPLLSNAVFTYDNICLLKENELKAQQLRALKNISAANNSSLRGTELLQGLLAEIRMVLPHEKAFIVGYAKDPPQHFYIIDYYSRTPVGVAKGGRYPCEESLLDRVVKQQTPLFIDDKASFPHQIEEAIFLDIADFSSALLWPLKIEGTVRGLLILIDIQEAVYPVAQDALAPMADNLALAIEKEKLLIDVSRRNREMETLRQIGSALASSTFDSDKVLTYTMELIRVIMNVEAGYLLLFDNGEMQFEAAFNIDIRSLKKLRLKLGQGISGYVADRGVIVMANKVEDHPHFSPDIDRQTGFRTRAVLSVPMVSQGKVIGVIEVLNKVEGVFNKEDEQLLHSIATSVSIALENSRLYRETVAMAESERGIRNLFQKFVPKEVVDKILQGPDSERPVIEEFRPLTLLNIDIRSSSPLALKIGPQKTVAMLNHFFSVMGAIVFGHQGIVDKYLGDGFLALFGAPVGSASDADNAISAALEMQQAMSELNDYFVAQFNTSLIMGISIHTGSVVIGNIGFEKKMDYTVIGDPVNFVFKLQALCKSWPNEILVTDATLQAAKSHYNATEVGTFEIEPSMGRERIYRVQG